MDRSQIEIKGYGRRLAAAAAGFGLLGVYVHGSAALGGFDPARNDLDLLLVIAESLPPDAQQALGDALLGSAYPLLGSALELSVITAAIAADLGSGLFKVHVATPGTVVIGVGHPGDEDLILYAEVCRRSGIAVVGPPATDVFAAVPPGRLLAAIHRELGWGLDQAPYEYAVLNACRAVRFTVDGLLTSKLAGGKWFLAHRDHRHPRLGDESTVRAALATQRGQVVDAPTRAAVVAFVDQARAIVTETMRPQR